MLDLGQVMPLQLVFIVHSQIVYFIKGFVALYKD